MLTPRRRLVLFELFLRGGEMSGSADVQPQPSEFSKFVTEMGGGKWSPVFNLFLESLSKNPAIDDDTRVTACLIRMSWAYRQPFVAKRMQIGGQFRFQPASEIEVATECEISRQRVSRVICRLKDNGFLESKGFVMILRATPVVASPVVGKEKKKTDDALADRFDSDVWRGQFAKEAARYDELLPSYREFNQITATKQKLFRRYVDERKNEGEAKENNLLTPTRSPAHTSATPVNKVRAQSAHTSATGKRSKPTPNGQNREALESIESTSPSGVDPSLKSNDVSQSVFSTDRLTDSEYALRLISEAIPHKILEELQDDPTRILLQEIHQLLQGAPPENFTRAIVAFQRRKKITALGILKHIARPVGNLWKRPNPQAQAPADVAPEPHPAWFPRTIGEAKAMLAGNASPEQRKEIVEYWGTLLDDEPLPLKGHTKQKTKGAA